MDTFLLLLTDLWRRLLCVVLGHEWTSARVPSKWKGWTAHHCSRCKADRYSLEGVRVVEWSLWR